MNITVTFVLLVLFFLVVEAQLESSRNGFNMQHVDFASSSSSSFSTDATKTIKKDGTVNSVSWDYLGLYHVHDTMGVKGEGVVIGISSSGVDLDHVGVNKGYRGYLSNGSYDNNYNYRNPYPGAPQTPTDFAVLGTMVAGIMAGPRGIGVAPEAKYIACKAMDDNGYETIESQIACIDFLTNPTDMNRLNPRIDKRPDIVYLTICESCFGTRVLYDRVKALRRAGIVVVTPSGYTIHGENKCGKIFREPANYREVISVGVSEIVNGSIFNGYETASGAAIINSTFIFDYLKPDWVAVGVDYTSAVMVNGVPSYVAASGTVMSTGIAAGVVALIMSANPLLRKQVRPIEDILKHSTSPKYSLRDACIGVPDPLHLCGSTHLCFEKFPNQSAPNFLIGAGNLNATAAVMRAREWPYGGCPIIPLSAAQCPDGGSGSIDIEHQIWDPEFGDQRINYIAQVNEGRMSDLGHDSTVRLCIYDSAADDAYPQVLSYGFRSAGNSWKKQDSSWTWQRWSAVNSGRPWQRSCSRLTTSSKGIYFMRFNVTHIQIEGSGSELKLSRVRITQEKMFECDQGLTVQFHSVNTHKCWSAKFTAPSFNTATRFKASY